MTQKRVLAAILAALLLILPLAAFAEETPPIAPTPEAVTEPTVEPTVAPTPEATPAPSAEPTPEPTVEPTPEVTTEPTAEPTPDPTAEPTTAPNVIDRRVTMGADLTAAQREAVYRDFGIEQGSVAELAVTNAEERKYLEGLVPERKIGSVALSCAYISVLESGAGLTIEAHNINFCSEDMYKNALLTAGITDAHVIVSAPFPVSGTGALTGIYKAYEDITGKTLNSLAKLVGVEELVLTGELAEYIGSAEASEIIAELKTVLDNTQSMDDASVKAEIFRVAEEYGVELTDALADRVLSLIRRFEGLDTEELQKRLTGLAETAHKASGFATTVQRVYEDVKSFFAAVGDFFKNLFGWN